MEALFPVVKILNAFRDIKRILYANGENRLENDVEHSYQLAMLAWYIIEKDQLPLDKDLVIQYALLHDLVEVYAGDVFFNTDDQDALDGKADREKEALGRLAKEFPEWPSMTRLITQYENGADEESRFVYALDKIQPIINVYLDGGRTWKEYNITLNDLRVKKGKQVKVSPPVEKIFNEIVEILEKNPQLFL